MMMMMMFNYDCFFQIIQYYLISRVASNSTCSVEHVLALVSDEGTVRRRGEGRAVRGSAGAETEGVSGAAAAGGGTAAARWRGLTRQRAGQAGAAVTRVLVWLVCPGRAVCRNIISARLRCK